MKSFFVGAAAALLAAWALPTPDGPPVGRYGVPLATASSAGFFDVDLEDGGVFAIFRTDTTSLAEAEGQSFE